MVCSGIKVLQEQLVLGLRFGCMAGCISRCMPLKNVEPLERNSHIRSSHSGSRQHYHIPCGSK